MTNPRVDITCAYTGMKTDATSKLANYENSYLEVSDTFTEWDTLYTVSHLADLGKALQTPL